MSEELGALYEKQLSFQKELNKDYDLPRADQERYDFYLQYLQDEVDELSDADNYCWLYRNNLKKLKYSEEKRLKELADVIIVAINLAIYSGIDSSTLFRIIDGKIDENYKKHILINRY